MLKKIIGALLAFAFLPAMAETVNYKALNPKNALVYKTGSGAVTFSVITDPLCGACRHLEKTLARIDNITVNKYLVNYFDSASYSQNIWCSKDRNQAFSNLMLHNIKPPSKSQCRTPLNQNMVVAKSYNLVGTPMIIKPNGETLYGSPPIDKLIEWLNN